MVDDLTPREEAERAILDHPGYLAFVEWEALNQTYMVVQSPNHDELAEMLNKASNDVETAFSLAPAAPEAERFAYLDQTQRLLFNYLASSSTLVDHSRRLMKRYEGTPLFDYYTSQRQELSESIEALFLKELRNFTLHRSLPPMLYRMSFDGQAQTMEGEIGLSTGTLLLGDWDRAAVKTFIEECHEAHMQVDLRPLVSRHNQLVRALYGWLFPQFQLLHGQEMQEVNRLIAKRNALLGTPT
jgi:hypothetical protein